MKQIIKRIILGSVFGLLTVPMLQAIEQQRELNYDYVTDPTVLTKEINRLKKVIKNTQAFNIKTVTGGSQLPKNKLGNMSLKQQQIKQQQLLIKGLNELLRAEEKVEEQFETGEWAY